MRAQIVGLWLMSRPLILPSGALAYAVGAAIASHELGPLDWRRQLVALGLTLLANLAAHFADEYADVDTDALATHTGLSGGSGAIANGLATRALALRAALVVSGLTLAGGLWAVSAGALPLAAGLILVIGLGGGWAYSLPPLALERRGWGEITNALLGGLLMPIMAYAATDTAPSARVYLQLAPIVAAAMACIIGVHWADRVADALVGKRTLAVILGRRVRWIWWACILLTYGLPVLLAPWAIPIPVAVAGTLTLPFGVYTAVRATRSDSPVPGGAMMVAFMLAHCIAYWAGAG